MRKEKNVFSLLSDKNRTLFSLYFCLDTTASSAQVQKNEKIKSQCPLSESSGAERHFYQTTYRNVGTFQYR